MPKLATLLAAALALAPLHASAQTPGTYRIAGRVVSASDDHPLPRASVKIYAIGKDTLIASTTADEQGAFAFPSVKAGSYSLVGSASGYISGRYLEHQGFSTAIITGAGVDTESLVLKLTLKASISGRVSDENGDPVRNANLFAYRENRDNGLTRIARFANTQSDDTGGYEFTELPPGKYFLSAYGTPWYAVHPQTPPANDGLGVVPHLDPMTDVAYPVTFYPEVTDSTQAAPILLRPGDQPEINLRLNPLPSMSISVGAPQSQPQPGPPQEQRQRTAPQFQVFKSVFGTLEQVPSQTIFNPNGSTLLGLPAGQYILKQVNSQGLPARTLNVNLTDQTTSITPGGGEELGSLELDVKTADGAKLSQPCHIMLVRSDATENPSTSTNPKSIASLTGIDPGDYSVRIFLGNAQGYVVSLTSDGKTLPANLLHINSGPNPSVTVTVAPANGTLTGFAKKEGQPAPGAMILLLPADPAQRGPQSWRDQSDLDGSFHLTGIPPGRYLLLALDNAWDLEFQRPGVLDHYLPLATPILIRESDTALKLPAPVTVQPL